jgi:hypothetical protein
LRLWIRTNVDRWRAVAGRLRMADVAVITKKNTTKVMMRITMKTRTKVRLPDTGIMTTKVTKKTMTMMKTNMTGLTPDIEKKTMIMMKTMEDAAGGMMTIMRIADTGSLHAGLRADGPTTKEGAIMAMMKAVAGAGRRTTGAIRTEGIRTAAVRLRGQALLTVGARIRVSRATRVASSPAVAADRVMAAVRTAAVRTAAVACVDIFRHQ